MKMPGKRVGVRGVPGRVGERDLLWCGLLRWTWVGFWGVGGVGASHRLVGENLVPPT